jgi:hypothetical protein
MARISVAAQFKSFLSRYIMKSFWSSMMQHRGISASCTRVWHRFYDMMTEMTDDDDDDRPTDRPFPPVINDPCSHT